MMKLRLILEEDISTEFGEPMPINVDAYLCDGYISIAINGWNGTYKEYSLNLEELECTE